MFLVFIFKKYYLLVYAISSCISYCVEEIKLFAYFSVLMKKLVGNAVSALSCSVK